MNAIWEMFLNSLSPVEYERIWPLCDNMRSRYEDVADDVTKEYIVFVSTGGRLVPPMPEVNVENFAW